MNTVENLGRVASWYCIGEVIKEHGKNVSPSQRNVADIIDDVVHGRDLYFVFESVQEHQSCRSIEKCHHTDTLSLSCFEHKQWSHSPDLFTQPERPFQMLSSKTSLNLFVADYKIRLSLSSVLVLEHSSLCTFTPLPFNSSQLWIWSHPYHSKVWRQPTI